MWFVYTSFCFRAVKHILLRINRGEVCDFAGLAPHVVVAAATLVACRLVWPIVNDDHGSDTATDAQSSAKRLFDILPSGDELMGDVIWLWKQEERDRVEGPEVTSIYALQLLAL
jgi:hypothetical protein